MNPMRTALALLVGCTALATSAEARQVPSYFQDQLVVGNLSEPSGLAFLPDGRLLVVERPGRVRLVVDGKLGVVDPLLVPADVAAGSPQAGLLGIAVDPAWPAQPYVYLHFTRADQTQQVDRYRAEGDLSEGSSLFLTIDPASRYVVLAGIPNLDPGRNGGGMRFGPEGALYVGVGDDGVPCAAQDTVSLKGVVLRLRTSTLPDGPGGPPAPSAITPADNPWFTHPSTNARLVWAIGLGDPFRFTIDPRDGRLLIGDAGGALYQEIDLALGSTWDFGWPHRDGAVSLSPSCPPVDANNFSNPVHAYPDTDAAGEARVIGGDLYLATGCATCVFPGAYFGDYFYADGRVGFVRRLAESGGVWSPAAPALGQPSSSDWARGFETISDLEVGVDGALWYCVSGSGASNGEVGRIVFQPPSASAGDAAIDGVQFRPPTPSPARGPVELAYRLPSGAEVSLAIFDAAGRRVRTLIATGVAAPGWHSARWDGRSDRGDELPAGAYLARLEVNGRGWTRLIARLR
jgi:glucose/arabinose dehydrogenase